MTRTTLLGMAALSVIALAGPANTADSIPAYIMAAVSDPARPPGDIARDISRHPAELMAFAGIKPGMKVADFIPFAGYHTRILAKLVGPKGHVYAVAPMWWGYTDLEAMIAENKELAKQGKPPVHANTVDAVLAIQNVAEYSNVTALLESLWAFNGQFSVPEQLDAVLAATGNYHDLHAKSFGVGDDKIDNVNKAIFAALKPGGVFVVVDHQTAAGAGFSQAEKLGRSESEAVKAEIAKAGFVLDGESKMLAVTADDHTASAIGAPLRDKADDFVLRFRKPLNASNTDMRPAANAMDGYYGNTAVMNLGIQEEPPREERRMFYHADGSYQEFGLPNKKFPGRGDEVQSGIWYWDAAGHNCMLHQFPADERGFTVCHGNTAINKKPGDKWMQGQTPFVMLKGQHPLPDPRAEQDLKNN